MDIVVLGAKGKFVDDFSEILKKNINCTSVHCCLDHDNYFQETKDIWVGVLLIEIDFYNFKKKLKLTDEAVKRNPNLVIIFLCDYLFVDWQKKASDRGVYLLNKKKGSLEIVSQILRIIKLKEGFGSDFKFKDVLTPREEEIIQLFAWGYESKEIEEELALSRKTIQNHLFSISKKLNTTSRLGSVVRAIELGIIELNYEVYEEF